MAVWSGMIVARTEVLPHPSSILSCVCVRPALYIRRTPHIIYILQSTVYQYTMLWNIRTLYKNIWRSGTIPQRMPLRSDRPARGLERIIHSPHVILSRLSVELAYRHEYRIPYVHKSMEYSMQGASIKKSPYTRYSVYRDRTGITSNNSTWMPYTCTFAIN